MAGFKGFSFNSFNQINSNHQSEGRKMQNTISLDRVQRAVDQACYPVRKVENGNGKFNLINGQTGGVISEVSQRYELVSNEKVFKPFVEKFGLENVKRFYQYGNGRYTFAEFETGRTFNLGMGTGQEDIIRERLVVQNSYDKTRAFSFMFGAFRMVCTNGLYSGQALIAFRKKHVGEIPIDDMVNNALNSYHANSFELWGRLKNVSLTKEQEISLLNDFQTYEVKKTEANSFYYDYNSNKQVNNRIQNIATRLIEKDESIDNQRNAWGLYNQINRAIANVIDNRTQINKVILGNKNAEAYLSQKLNLN
ncbi:MAG: DUF932 domain-containing protein [Ginsengibacter sp.]